MKRIIIALILAFVLSLSFEPMVTQGNAETLIGSNVDNRIVVALHVDQTELQHWVPAPWQVISVPKGPLKDTNLYVMFVDRLLNQDAEGKPTAGGTFCFTALVAPAKNTQTGEIAPFVIRIFAPHEDISLYNPYKNSVRATVRREQTLKCEDFDRGTGSETWELRDSAGGMMQFQIEYQRAVPLRAKEEMRPHSAVDPEFFRIYRVDQGSDMVKSTAAGIDRVKNYQLRVTISELGKLFDGKEQLVGIIVMPWYVRQLSLP